MADDGKAKIVLSAEDKTKVAFDSVKKNMRELGDQADKFGASFGTLGIAIAGAFEAASLKHIIDSADELNKLSQKTGIAADSLSALKYAGSLADVGIDDLATGIRHLGNTMADAAGGSKEAQAIFSALGVSFKNANGTLRSTDEVLGDVATKFSTYADGAGKAALATGLFGKNGTTLIPFLNQGREGIEAARKEAEQFGIVMGPEFAKRAEEFNDNLTRISAAAKATKISLAEVLLPSIVDLTNELVEGRKIFGGYLEAIVQLGVKRPAFESYGEGANAAHKEVAELTAQLDKLNTATQQAADTAGGAALLGPRQRGGTGAKSALMQRLDEAKKVEQYFNNLNLRKLEAEAKRLDEIFWGGPQVKGAAPITDKSGGKTAKEKAGISGPPLDRQEAFRQFELLTQATTDQALAAGQLAEFDKARADALKLIEEHAKHFNDLLAATPTEQLEVTRADMQLLADAFERGKITAEQFSEAAQTRLGTLPDKFKDVTTELDKFAKRAAGNIEGALGETVYQGLSGRFDNIGQLWSDLLKRMVAESIATNLSKSLFGENFSKTGAVGGIGGDILKGFGTYFGFRAGGGPVASGSPYIVGERGPEMFVPSVAGNIVPTGKWGGAAAVNSTANIYVDSSTDVAKIGSMIGGAMQAYDQQLMQRLKTMGVTA